MKTKILLAILCVCFSINLHSQEGEIIYTDFEPDSVMTDVPYGTDSHLLFDINYDNIYDVGFYYSIPTSEGVEYFFIKDYNEYFNISLKQVWGNDTLSNIRFSDLWNEARLFSGGEKYIGLRINLGDDNYCYGWVKYRLYSGWSDTERIILYDMAYCTVPNYPLRVGQKSFDDTLINDTSEFKDYVLFPSPANDKIALKFNNHYYYTFDNEIKIYSIDGRLLKTQNSDFDNIDISNLSNGVYIMKIYLGNGESYTEKFVKK